MNDDISSCPGSTPAPAARVASRSVAPLICALGLVGNHEIAALRRAVMRGHVPLDLQRKLARLKHAGLIHHFIQQNSELFLALLMAAEDGQFRAMAAADRERLLRVLAYVRKDNDLIPDDQPGGYVDDYQEVRAAVRELASALQTFKEWRLCHQVPVLWSRHPGNAAAVVLTGLPLRK